VSAAVVTSDHEVLLGLRSARVAEAQQLWDLPGGNVPYVEGAGAKPFEAMRVELREELDLQPSDIRELNCVALVENGVTHKPDLVFLCRIRQKAKPFLKRLRATAHLEHDDFRCVRLDKAELAEFMRRRADELSPVAAGGLAVFVSDE
jgi:8-oxo-dGTP pyrophosphatase MutT (NUDIX family)